MYIFGGKRIIELTSSSLPCSRYVLASCGEKIKLSILFHKSTFDYHTISVFLQLCFVIMSIKTPSIVRVDGNSGLMGWYGMEWNYTGEWNRTELH